MVIGEYKRKAEPDSRTVPESALSIDFISVYALQCQAVRFGGYNSKLNKCRLKEKRNIHFIKSSISSTRSVSKVLLILGLKIAATNSLPYGF